MTDRKLLEAAAKAAGELNSHWQGNEAYFDGVLSRWNPLDDDGDALRLAVKLNLIVHKGFVYTPTGRLFDHRDYANPMTATRRAIVRAAAEIGRGKE
jgi:hypothetical protein